MSYSETWVLNNNITYEEIINLIQACKTCNLTGIQIDAHHLLVTGDAESHQKVEHKQVEYVLKNNDLNGHTYLKPRTLNAHVNTSFTPIQLAEIYNFPIGDGTGQKIGIIELTPSGYSMSDINTYLTHLNISTQTNITDVSVLGAVNNPNDNSGAGLEVVLDLEIIVSLVPKAEIRMYFAPNSFNGFYQAILQSINDGCKLVSISWGIYESAYGSTNLTAYNNLFKQGADLGVTFFVAAGDNGSSDGSSGNNVDFPSSSPNVVACGGTTLTAVNNIRTSEVVWNNSANSSTGGGISSFFDKPSYQNNITYPLIKRGTPDISANADPNTGYVVYYKGSNVVVGGTSAVAPLMTALFARINQHKQSNVGFVHPILYNNNIYYDITSGNNGAYSAITNWDPCSGLGVINGQLLTNLFNVLTASFTYNISNYNVTFTNTSINGTSYLWHFGDNQTSTLTNPTHTYTIGSYTVTLTATNSNGSNTITQVINIVLPTANFTYIISNNNVIFTNTSVNCTSYSWNFGDGHVSTLQNPTYIYSLSGSYTVTLTVTNNNGTNSINHVVVVVVPIANFSASPLTGLEPLTVNFTNTSTNAASYLWHFGDGNITTLPNPTHVYNAGTYNVSLTANTNIKLMNNYITVLSNLSANFYNIVVAPLRRKVLFINTSVGNPTKYLWDFGNYNYSVMRNPTCIYNRAGTYHVTLTIYKNNTSNTITKQIVLH